MKKILGTVVCAILLSPAMPSAQSADSLLHFIQANKNRSSAYLIKNDTVRVALNENEMMPLASTMKMMVALEFSKQAAFKVFDTGKLVALNELNKYYLPLTDGNAHPQWVNYEKNRGVVVDDSISLMQIARGMIMFSSNANTEFLMDLLGLQNINGNYRLLGARSYTPLYYLVSSLFLYQNPKQMKEEKVLKEIHAMSESDYIKACESIHQQLKNNPGYNAAFRLNDLTPPMQKVWSDKLPVSTTSTYARIANTLNKRLIFGDETYKMLSKVLETVMENPANQQWLNHAGMKGGSTMFVLTKCLYGTLQNGDQIALAYFFNDLTPAEQGKLQGWMNDFELAVLSDEEFVKRFAAL